MLLAKLAYSRRQFSPLRGKSYRFWLIDLTVVGRFRPSGKSYAFVQSHSEPSGAFTALFNRQWFAVLLAYLLHPWETLEKRVEWTCENFIGTRVGET